MADQYGPGFQVQPFGCHKSNQAARKGRVYPGGASRRWPSQGNLYKITDKFYCLNMQHGRTATVAFSDNRKINHEKELKRTTGNAFLDSLRGLSFKTANQARLADPKGKASRLLRENGVDARVAEAIVYSQQHSFESIDNAIQNALARFGDLKITDPFRAEQFKLAAYIVGSLNQARREVHPIKLAGRVMGLKKRAAGALKTWAPISDAEFANRRRAQFKRLLVLI